MPQRSTISFECLVLDLYSALEPGGSWAPFLERLCGAMRLEAGTLILRLPSPGDRGELYSWNVVTAFEEVYRSQSYLDDPFRDMPIGVPLSLADVISAEALHASSFYRELLQPDGTTDILALNIPAGDAHPAVLRLSRRRPEDPFGLPEKSLLMRLLPYLSNAFVLHEQRRRLLLERAAHIGALDQLAFGLVIVDERGGIVRVNEHAQRLLDRSRLLRADGGRLRGPGPSARSSGQQVEDIIAAMHHATEGERHFLRLTDTDAGEFVQMLFRPITPPARATRARPAAWRCS